MEYDDEQDSQVPAMSAGRVHKHKSSKKSNRSLKIVIGCGKKPKYRDMILNAIKSFGETKGTNFAKICRFIEKKYKLRNDFVVKHTLKWLLNKKMLMNCGGRYKIISPLAPSAGRRRRKARRRGKSRKRRKGGKKKGKKRRRGGRRLKKKRSSRKRGGRRRGNRKRGGKRRKGRRGRRARRKSR